MKYKCLVPKKFFSFFELDKIFADNYSDGLSEKDIKELKMCMHLLGITILSTRRPYLLGKVLEESNPFDLCLVDKEVYDSSPYKPEFELPIQLKSIVDSERRGDRIPIDDWINLVQMRINEACNKYSETGNFILHLQNDQGFEDFHGEEGDLKKIFSRVIFPKNNCFTQVTLSILFYGDNDILEMFTWQLFPSLKNIDIFSGKDLEEIKKICQ